jgi:hypothetical protein
MCRSGCPTQNHSTWGECARAARLQVAPIANLQASKAWDAELNAYRDAKRQGVNPSGTTMQKVSDAMEISQRTGKAFDSENVIESISV